MNDLPNQLGIKKPNTGDPKIDEYLRHVLERLDKKFKLLAEDIVTANGGLRLPNWRIVQEDSTKDFLIEFTADKGATWTTVKRHPAS